MTENSFRLFIAILLAVFVMVFLPICFLFSQNGRYEQIPSTSYRWDTRTGRILDPYQSGPQRMNERVIMETQTPQPEPDIVDELIETEP